jgi:hypothetical protein
MVVLGFGDVCGHRAADSLRVEVWGYPIIAAGLGLGKAFLRGERGVEEGRREVV